MTDPFERQVGGTHYIEQGIQPIDLILSNGLDFGSGCVVKYAVRWPFKGAPVQDLQKIIQYAEFMLAFIKDSGMTPEELAVYFRPATAAQFATSTTDALVQYALLFNEDFFEEEGADDDDSDPSA